MTTAIEIPELTIELMGDYALRKVTFELCSFLQNVSQEDTPKELDDVFTALQCECDARGFDPDADPDEDEVDEESDFEDEEEGAE